MGWLKELEEHCQKAVKYEGNKKFNEHAEVLQLISEYRKCRQTMIKMAKFMQASGAIKGNKSTGTIITYFERLVDYDIKHGENTTTTGE